MGGRLADAVQASCINPVGMGRLVGDSWATRGGCTRIATRSGPCTSRPIRKSDTSNLKGGQLNEQPYWIIQLPYDWCPLESAELYQPSILKILPARQPLLVPHWLLASSTLHRRDLNPDLANLPTLHFSSHHPTSHAAIYSRDEPRCTHSQPRIAPHLVSIFNMFGMYLLFTNSIFMGHTQSCVEHAKDARFFPSKLTDLNLLLSALPCISRAQIFSPEIFQLRWPGSNDASPALQTSLYATTIHNISESI